MTLLLIVPAWILLLLLATGLCMAARAGDDGQHREALTGDLVERPLWERPMSEVELNMLARGRTRSQSGRVEISKAAGVEIAA